MLVTATSSSDPVASFRYRAMKGTVAPSANSLAVAATCRGCTLSSPAILTMCASFIPKQTDVHPLSNASGKQSYADGQDSTMVRLDYGISGVAASRHPGGP